MTTTKPDMSVLKCRFCGFTVKKWSKKKGQSKSGLPRLLKHIEDAHGVSTDLAWDGEPR